MNVVVAGDVVHLAEVARRLVPHLHVLSIAQPEPVLRERNVITMVPASEDPGDSVLLLESIVEDDAPVGVVAMGAEPATDVSPAIDRERPTTPVGPRVLAGGLVAALVGAAVLGTLAALLFDGPGVLGAMVGGAAVFGPFGATWAVFGRRDGVSDPYGQPLVDAQPAAVTVVSYHTEDQAQAEVAFERLRASGHRNVVILDASGAHMLRRNDGS